MAASSKSDKAKAGDKKVFDVAKPGKSAPDATGRPIIVGHKPMIQDPMVNSTAENSASEESASKEEKAPVTRSTKKIVPLSEPEETPSAEKAVKEDAAEDAASQEPASTEPANKPSEAPDEEAADKPETDESAAVDALANQAVRRKEGELTEEEKKRAEAINKLIEDKTYYVRVGQAHQKRNTSLIIVLVLFAVAVAGLAVAMDAGFVQSNIELPFDFIPN